MPVWFPSAGSDAAPERGQVLLAVAERELELASHQEVPVQGVVAVDPDTAVHMDCGVYHPEPAFGCPPAGDGHGVVGGKALIDAPGGLPPR